MTLPVGRAWPRWWLVASVAAHFVVLTAMVRFSTSWRRDQDRSHAVFTTATPGESNRQIVLYLPSAPAQRAGKGTGEAPGRAAGLAASVVVTPLPPADSSAPVLRLGAGGRDTATLAVRGSRTSTGRFPRGVTNYTPQLGDGRPWVDPTGSIVATGSREIRIDSAVAVRMEELADSMEKNPGPDPNANPYVSRPWTFRVGGKTYGIDSKGIHLGDFTIPTAVLAFLSLPQGNIDQARANQALMAMRADILRAAARAQTEEDFRRQVREIRERKEKEHQEEQQKQQPQPTPQP